MNAPLRSYAVRFEHDHGYSETNLEAASLDDAFRAALQMDPRDAVFIETYDVNIKRCDYLHIRDCETREALDWTEPAQHMREHAVDAFAKLMRAGRMLRAAPRFEAHGDDSRALAAEIDEFIAIIEGGDR